MGRCNGRVAIHPTLIYRNQIEGLSPFADPFQKSQFVSDTLFAAFRALIFESASQILAAAYQSQLDSPSTR